MASKLFLFMQSVLVLQRVSVTFCYLQENQLPKIFKMTHTHKKKKKRASVTKGDREYQSAFVFPLSTHLSLRQLLLVNLLDLGAVGQQVA